MDGSFHEDPIEPDPGPIEVLPDDDNNNGVGPVEPEIPRDGNGNNIPLLPIVGASVGGIALIVAAAFFRRRKLATATDDGLSGIDSSAMGPSNSDDV